MEDGLRVYMNPHDYQTMLDSAESRRAEVVMQSMGDIGLRVSECVSEHFTMANIRESTDPDVNISFLRLYSKDTKSRETDGKRRDAWVPPSTIERLEEYQDNEGFADDRRIFMCTKRTLQREVNESSENAAVMEGNSDYEHISCHDFRAYFATNMALREGVDIETVMTLGGWEDRESMDPYLDANFDDIIQEQLALAGLLNEDIGVQSDYERLRQEIQNLREAVEGLDVDVSIPEPGDGQRGITDFS
jgi:integrase